MVFKYLSYLLLGVFLYVFHYITQYQSILGLVIAQFIVVLKFKDRD